jgi:hypothetical protein
MVDSVITWLIPALAWLALGLSAFNAVAWPRGSSKGKPPALGRQSICIPARNEEATIASCVRAALALNPMEVIVGDDASTDGTAKILQRLSREDPRLRVLRLDGMLRPGWVGKPYVCDRLAREARGDSLLFLDADVIADPSLLSRLASIKERYRADVITVFPRQVMGTLVERLLIPLLHLTYTSWFPLPLIWRSRNARFLAANGQMLWTTRDTLGEVGGFDAVKGEIVDDMALCRVAKRAGKRVVFADGHHMGRCRMYRSARAVMDGFSKNLYEGVGGVSGLTVVVLLYGSAFLAPWVALLMTPVVPGMLAPGVLGVAAGILLRLLHVWRHGAPLLSAVLHPVGVLLLFGIALRSALWNWRGAISWSGRVYAPRSVRLEMVHE